MTPKSTLPDTFRHPSEPWRCCRTHQFRRFCGSAALRPAAQQDVLEFQRVTPERRTPRNLRTPVRFFTFSAPDLLGFPLRGSISGSKAATSASLRPRRPSPCARSGEVRLGLLDREGAGRSHPHGPVAGLRPGNGRLVHDPHTTADSAEDGQNRASGFAFDRFYGLDNVGQDQERFVSACDMAASLDVTAEFAQGRSGMERSGRECPIISTID